MRLLSCEAFEQMSVIRTGRRHPVADVIEQLKVDDVLHIPGSGWSNRARPPRHLVTRVATAMGREFTFSKVPKERAWVVKRIQ